MNEERPPKPSEQDPIGICGHEGMLRHSFYLTEPKTIGDLWETGAGIPEDMMSTLARPVHWLAVCDACSIMAATEITIRLVRRLGDLRNDARGYRN